jgi:hypothetical protein
MLELDSDDCGLGGGRKLKTKKMKIESELWTVVRFLDVETGLQISKIRMAG